jgi:AraC-like DNA-binding protein
MDNNTHFDIKTSQFDNFKMFNFKKYLPISETDKSWGFVVHDVGYAVIQRQTQYPPVGHPGSHQFLWEKGRALDEHHFVLITEGKGIFESESAGPINVEAGDGFILFPNEWHRYKPKKKIGWTEYWVGFSGVVAENVMKDIFFSQKTPVVHNCANALVKNLFKSLFQLILEEPYGFQRTASGICLQLIAEICNIQKSSESTIQNNSLIAKAKYFMHQKIDEDIDLQSFCSDQGISYSKFRSDFKQHTSFAPLQYFILMKIEKSKDLLVSTDMSIKQIAFELGFKTDHYFSRIFKDKTGFSPLEFKAAKRKIH